MCLGNKRVLYGRWALYKMDCKRERWLVELDLQAGVLDSTALLAKTEKQVDPQLG